MKPWETDKAWSDLFIRQLKQIAGLHTFSIGNQIQDTEEGTDLIILEGKPYRVACRVRRPKFYPEYKHEFTIRSRRANGARTEWPKMMSEDETWKHLYIYAFSDNELKIAAYHVIDIPIFRIWAFDLIATNGGKMPIEEKSNHDGTWFYPFALCRLPRKAIIHTTVASAHPGVAG